MIKKIWEVLALLLSGYSSSPEEPPADVVEAIKSQPAPAPAPVAAAAPSEECAKQGWSKNISDCTSTLQAVWQPVHDEFLAKHPELTMRVDYTWRSPEYQMELFRKGRMMNNGQWIIIDKNQIVTQVQKGHHNVYPSQAFDFIIFRNGQPVWTTDQASKDLYIEAGTMFMAKGVVAGAVWRYNWRDYGHVQQAYTIV